MAYIKRGWIAGVLWTSEPADAQVIREELQSAIFRTVWIQEHGPAHTLREMLAQESFAMRNASCTQPKLDEEDLAYTREILEPLLDASDRPTVMSALFGDPAAHSLGYRPLGLSDRAGLALALATASL